MAATAIAHQISPLEVYQALPEGAQYQLIEGKIVEMPAPLIQHQRLSFKLALLLGNFIEANQLGEMFAAPCDVYLSEKNVYQPDLLFISAENARIIERHGVMGAPDVVIELLSDGTDTIDKKKKLLAYEKYGVKEYFIIDPEDDEVISYYLEDGRYKAGYRSYKSVESKVLGKTFTW